MLPSESKRMHHTVMERRSVKEITARGPRLSSGSGCAGKGLFPFCSRAPALRLNVSPLELKLGVYTTRDMYVYTIPDTTTGRMVDPVSPKMLFFLPTCGSMSVVAMS